MTRPTPTFSDRVGALWAELGLGANQVGRDTVPFLEIDGQRVELAERPNGGAVVISATIGRLTADDHARGEEVRRLLRRALGLLPLSRCGLRLARRDDARPEVVVEAIIPLARAEPKAMVALVEDVVACAGAFAGDLQPAQSSAPPVPRAVRASLESDLEPVIFRP
ncbi:type III secretion system chaperone [Chthonobacter rhizosphaerae]|uniref:type III secretion system chaperone n=1 Tax=Chthonobacter rhizosphaerae TaxID=2735553 RepID=UPI0015EF7891|nr:type III secretion system chaperone [Chthonobacter rhizosphaerae]